MVSYHEHMNTKMDRDMLQVSDAKCFQEAEFVSLEVWNLQNKELQEQLGSN